MELVKTLEGALVPALSFPRRTGRRWSITQLHCRL